jgi:hypothetical protein
MLAKAKRQVGSLLKQPKRLYDRLKFWIRGKLDG